MVVSVWQVKLEGKLMDLFDKLDSLDNTYSNTCEIMEEFIKLAND